MKLEMTNEKIEPYKTVAYFTSLILKQRLGGWVSEKLEENGNSYGLSQQIKENKFCNQLIT